MNLDPIRVRGLIYIKSKLRSLDQTTERPGFKAIRDL